MGRYQNSSRLNRSVGGISVDNSWLYNNPDLRYPDNCDDMTEEELIKALTATPVDHTDQMGCQGYTSYSMDGDEYECGYNTAICCEDCKYGGHGGRLDPAAKCNQI